MSNKGIYSALSGAVAQTQRLDTIANNIANVGTTGFKKDRQVFREYLSAYEKQPEVIEVPKIPAAMQTFYDMQGGDRSYVDGSGTFTDFQQGTLKQTQNNLDVGIEGKGFFEVWAKGGLRLTRNGAFQLDSEGRLVTREGYPVLAQGQGGPNERGIEIAGRNVTISYSGEIYSDGQLVNQISVVEVPKPDELKKIGSSLYAFKNDQPVNIAPPIPIQNDQGGPLPPTPAQGEPPHPGLTIPASGYKLHQGFLENSNINIIGEMTDMIGASRSFESNQKMIQAFDQMNNKLVNEVPRLR